MFTIQKIKIEGFRRLKDIELEMRPFMVLIGANGVGKTSFLNALSLISASAAGNLNDKLSQLGGISSLLTRNISETLSFHIDVEIPDYNPLKYQLTLSPKPPGYSISNETLTQEHENYPDPFQHIYSKENNIRYYSIEEHKIVWPTWEHDPLETALAQVPKMYKQPETLRRILATTTLYHVLDVGPLAPVKMPQLMKPAEFPGPNGEDIVPYLYYLRESDRDRFAVITDSLRAAFTSFEELNFPPVATGTLTMTWKDSNYTKPFNMNELSEGTLRFLWLVSLLQSPKLPAVTMIDEPDVSMHPEMLSLLTDLMREASNRTRLIVATHSDRFVRFLYPEEVVVLDVEDEGWSSAKYADTLDIDHWLSDYTLDEVWQMGRMGGRS